jgi:hypothetical protein
MSRFQASNPSQYGAKLDADQVSSLIDAGAGLVSAVSNVIPSKKKPANKPAKRPAPKQNTSAPPPAQKSNTALWVGGGVATLAILVLAGLAISRRG